MKKNNSGFTIIELAIALTIIAFIVGGLAIPLSTRLIEQQYTDTQASIDKATEALVGFAIINGRLPCPDSSTTPTDNRDGIEDFTGAPITGCNAAQSDPNGASWGDLPWRTLGLQAPNNSDAWNNRLRYAVYTPLVTQATPTPAPICSNIGFANLGCISATTGATTLAQLDIRCANPSTTTPATAALGCLSTTSPVYTVTQNAVFVVYSHGANGWGSTSINDLGTFKLFITPTTIPDQMANSPINETTLAARRQFVTRTRSSTNSNTGEYDDVLYFMSSNNFASKLLAAGIWPN